MDAPGPHGSVPVRVAVDVVDPAPGLGDRRVDDPDGVAGERRVHQARQLLSHLRAVVAVVPWRRERPLRLPAR